MPTRLPYKHILDESAVAQDLRRVVTLVAALAAWGLSFVAALSSMPCPGSNAWEDAPTPGHHVFFSVASALSGAVCLYLTIKGSRPADFRRFLWGVGFYTALCLLMFGWFDHYYGAIYRRIECAN